MNRNIQSLVNIAQKSSRKIIGLMSGTSLDGLDIAVCEIYGYGTNTKVKIEHFATLNYDASFKAHIKAIFSKQLVSLEKVCVMNSFIGSFHANLINKALAHWGINASEIDAIASHGQTIYHAPKSLHKNAEFDNATLQIGDADHIAVKTGILTVSDFRQKHIAAGGEGAPLAVYGDYLLFSNELEDRILLNIGGIANFTYLPKSKDASTVFSTDVGPGNTLMDAYIQKYFDGLYFDENATIASKGEVNLALLNALKQEDYYKKPFPKTTGPELFNLSYVDKAKEISNTQNISHYDCVATLNKLTADIIVNALKSSIPNQEYTIYISGGGLHNPLLMQHIQQQLYNITFLSTEVLDINPNAKEAVLFAVLANECLVGEQTYLSNGVSNVTMGKISFPW